MASELPKLYLVRHGDTEWTDSHRRTSRTDLPLTARGEELSRKLGQRLRGLTFVRVFTSPLQRATMTCALAGFTEKAEVDQDLVEWNYGSYEGKQTKEILFERAGWELFHDGCPGGESPSDVALRAARFIAKIQNIEGNVAAFSSGHIIRMIAASWVGLAPAFGRVFYCNPATVGVLGFEHNRREEPVVHLWNSAEEPLA